MGLITSLFAAALLVVAPTVGAVRAQEPSDIAQLEQAFNVQSVPSDYVIVVDTSSSMVEGADPLYPKVRAAHEGLIDQIPDNANVSVVTFDTVPVVRFSGQLTPANRAEAKALPDAVGQATDIGAALDSAVSRLDRPDAARTQTVIFVTDGRHDPPNNSAFAEPGNDAWTAARDRATALASNRDIAVRALGLGDAGKSGAELVGQVFPKTEVVQLSGEQLGEYLAQEAGNARRRVLADAVRNEITSSSVTAKVDAPEGLDNEVPAKVTLTNGLPHLGVDVDLKLVTAVDNKGQPVRVSIVDGSRIIHLPPAGAATFEALVKPDIEPGPLFQMPPPEREELDITLKLDGTAVALPTQIIQKDLGVDPAVKVSAPDQFTVGRDVGITWGRFFLRIGLFLLALLISFWIWNKYVKQRKLNGYVIRVQRTNEDTELRGKRFTVSPNDLKTGSTSTAVRFYTRRFKRSAVFVDVLGQGSLQWRRQGAWVAVQQGSKVVPLTPMRIDNGLDFVITHKRSK